MYEKIKLEELAETLNISTMDLLETLEVNIEKVKGLYESTGKYTVRGFDRLLGKDWLQGKYKTAEKALAEARRLTKEAKLLDPKSSPMTATMYYAYDYPSGICLGGTECWDNYVGNKK